MKKIFTRRKTFLVFVLLIILFQIIKDKDDFIKGIMGN